MQRELDWIDLPNEDYTLVLGYNTPESRKLNELIKQYNQLTKDREDSLINRIDLLSQIESWIENWLKNLLSGVEKNKHLQWIAEIATKKRRYLESLQALSQENFFSIEALEEKFTSHPSLIEKTESAVLLNPKRFFSLKMREYWGDFYWEAIDPCHRKLTPFLIEWEKTRTDFSVLSFFLWLETKHLPKYVPVVRYLTPCELKRAQVTVQNGVMIEKATRELLQCCDPKEKYLFAIDLDKNFYVAKESDGCSHSSFTHGYPVLGAGIVKVENGKLLSLSLESGHYLPSLETGHTILRCFMEMGLDLREEFDLSYFFDRNKYTVKINHEAIASLEILSSTVENARKKECVTL